MKLLRAALLVLALPVTVTGCQLKDNSAPLKSDEGPPPIPPPPDVAAPPAGALKTASGLASRVLTVGLGSARPTLQSKVTIHYTGWTTDGKMFDSSYTRPGPTTMTVSDFVPGFKEALQLLVVGEKRRFWIPGNLAYDNSPREDAPKGMLVFDVELLQIK